MLFFRFLELSHRMEDWQLRLRLRPRLSKARMRLLEIQGSRKAAQIL
jgi:hypothetical protein